MSTEGEKKKDQVYIGHLSRKVREEDLRREFERFGKVADLSIKNHYAFIVWYFVSLMQTFNDSQDAEKAIKEMDGKKLEGEEIKVELASKERKTTA